MAEYNLNKVYLMPTGNEILNGTVRDLDTAEILSQVVFYYPAAEVVRLCPLVDEEDTILKALDSVVSSGADMIIMVGGSGGGHRFSTTLGKDFTHSALQQYLDVHTFREIYGKNGHLWSKLVCGKKGETLIVNVPGPFVEAKAAAAACLKAMSQGAELEQINQAMSDAVFAQYPQ